MRKKSWEQEGKDIEYLWDNMGYDEYDAEDYGEWDVVHFMDIDELIMHEYKSEGVFDEEENPPWIKLKNGDIIKSEDMRTTKTRAFDKSTYWWYERMKTGTLV